MAGWWTERSSAVFGFAVCRGFDITDVAALPEGGALLLERRFRYSEGIKMRIRQLSANEINRDKRLDGRILFEADGQL